MLNSVHYYGEGNGNPVLLPGKAHGQRSLVGCSPWGRKESDRTEWLHFHFSLSCIGEGNGNPLQCSCLENPRDGGAWWAAIYGVAQDQTRLKQLSSSSSSSLLEKCKSKLQFYIISHWSEWWSSKNSQTINAGGGMEKREPSCTIGGNGNWYSHYGRQYGDSFKKLGMKQPYGPAIPLLGI